MKNIYLIIISTLLIVSCGGSSDGGGDVTPEPQPPTGNNNGGSSGGTPPVVIVTPQAATLTFPENAEVCTDAKDLTSRDSSGTYTIGFQWNGDASTANPVNYTVNLTNVDSSSTESIEAKSITTTNVTLDIPGIIPEGNYSWEIIASRGTGADEKTATSTKQTFIAAGIAEISFAPNTPNATQPKTNAVLPTAASVDLQWEGNESNEEIKEYEVFFGTTNPPTNKIATTPKGTTSSNTSISSDTIYYWKVIAIDNNDNKSESPVFKFAVL